MSELKPCPFCGGSAVLLPHRFSDGFVCCGIVCRVCSARTSHFYATEKEAIEAWNRRFNDETD